AVSRIENTLAFAERVLRAFKAQGTEVSRRAEPDAALENPLKMTRRIAGFPCQNLKRHPFLPGRQKLQRFFHGDTLPPRFIRAATQASAIPRRPGRRGVRQDRHVLPSRAPRGATRPAVNPGSRDRNDEAPIKRTVSRGK